MISAVITDDEVLARQKLSQLLREEPDVELLGEASSAMEAIELVKATRPDVLFLDIHMPGMDGFDTITAMSDEGVVPLPRIIFTTAYDKYALKAFEIHAVDYLLKPYTRERFKEALARARAQLEQAKTSPATAEAGREAPLDRLIFKSRGRIVFLPISELFWVTAEENYVRLSTNSENHMLRDTISNFESRLDPTKFLRIHRSTIVNLKYVKEIRTDSLRGEFAVVMTNGQKLSVSRGYRPKIMELVTA